MEDNNTNKYIDKLINELKLHDAEITGIKLNNSELEFKVSCEWMNVDSYFDNIDNIFFRFYINKIKRISFDFDGLITINSFELNKNDNLYILNVNNKDLYIEFEKCSIEYNEVTVQSNENKKLDDLLKRNI